MASFIATVTRRCDGGSVCFILSQRLGIVKRLAGRVSQLCPSAILTANSSLTLTRSIFRVIAIVHVYAVAAESLGMLWIHHRNVLSLQVSESQPGKQAISTICDSFGVRVVWSHARHERPIVLTGHHHLDDTGTVRIAAL